MVAWGRGRWAVSQKPKFIRKSFISVSKSTTKGLQTYFMDVNAPRKRFGRAELIYTKQTVYLQQLKGKQGSKVGIM